MKEAADYELQNARQRLTVHRRTGRLSAATAVRVFRTTGARVVRLSNDAKSSRGKEYAELVDQGNGTGYIYPRTAKFLRFRIGPVWVFARRVRAYSGSKVFMKAQRSGYLQAGFLLRSRLAAIANNF